MNPAFEETQVEALTEEQIQAIERPDDLQRQLEVIRTRCASIQLVDALAVKQVAALVETCTFASRYAETRRTTIVQPLNKEVDEANAIWQPIVKGFKEIARAKGAEVSRWIDDQRQAQARLQQKAIDDAKAAQALLDRKADQERQDAEVLRLKADAAASVSEAEALHLQADKLEKKSELHTLQASQVVTAVVPTEAKAIDLGSSTFVAKAPKKTWMLAGWDKAKPLRLTDPKLAGLLGDVSSLTPAARFLLVHADLNPVYLNKSFGVVEFPAPFASVDDFGGSAVRGK